MKRDNKMSDMKKNKDIECNTIKAEKGREKIKVGKLDCSFLYLKSQTTRSGFVFVSARFFASKLAWIS